MADGKEHTKKQMRKTEHLEDGLKKRGLSDSEATSEAWDRVDNEAGKQGRGKSRNATGRQGSVSGKDETRRQSKP